MTDERNSIRPGTIIKLNRLDVEDLDSFEWDKEYNKVNSFEVRIEELMPDGYGSTCIAYRGMSLQDGRKVVVKEFYPQRGRDVLEIGRMDDETQKLIIENPVTKKNCASRLNQFFRCYQMQRQFYKEDKFLECVCEPQAFASYGDSFYIVSDFHMGTALSQKLSEFQTLEEKLSLMQRVTDLMCVLEEQGYLLLDLKPSNILYIQQTSKQSQMRLFDLDSVIRLADVKNMEKLSEIRFSKSYAPWELQFFYNYPEKFGSYKEEYLQKKMIVHNLGVIFFELLFDYKVRNEAEIARILSGDGRKKYEELCVEKYQIKMKQAVEFLDVICGAVQKPAERKYDNCVSFFHALKELEKQMEYEKYVPKKKIAQANYSYVSYNMLENYPVYDFYSLAERRLDVVITGTHPMRKAMLQNIASCVQMLDTRLVIHVLTEDAIEFWNQFRAENPYVEKAVIWTENGIDAKNQIDLRVVNRPIAELNLISQEDMQEKAISLLKENGLAYFILLDKDFDENTILARKLLKETKSKIFVGYLSEEELQIETDSTLHQLPRYLISKDYKEKQYKSRVMNMAFDVHDYYYRGYKPQATKEESRGKFIDDQYNIDSSARSAIHTLYKLKSIGIEPKDKDAAWNFWDKVLTKKDEKAKERFIKLTTLEHRAWTAFMIFHGAEGIRDIEKLQEYAYVGSNDWKNKEDPDHIIHVCLEASHEKSFLTQEIWENYQEILQNGYEASGLDALDYRSLETYDQIKKLIQKKNLKKKTDDILEEIRENVPTQMSVYVDAINDAKVDCFENVRNAKVKWDTAISTLEDIYEARGGMSSYLESLFKDLKHKMRPVLDFLNYRDFKKSDEDVLHAIPSLLMKYTKLLKIGEKITLIKPLSEVRWENLFSTILIEPTRLLLVSEIPGNQNQLEKEYEATLKKLELDVDVEILTMAQLRQKKYVGKILVDGTGLAIEELKEKFSNCKLTQKAFFFELENRRLKPIGDTDKILVFQRPMNLSVKQTLHIQKADYQQVKAEGEKEALKDLCYHECSRKNIFVDIEKDIIISDVKVDLIATKDSRTFFIMTDMGDKTQKDFEALSEICKECGIEGVGIVISSQYTGKFDIKADNIEFLGKDKIDVVDECGVRRVLIADSVREVVEKYR